MNDDYCDSEEHEQQDNQQANRSPMQIKRESADQ